MKQETVEGMGEMREVVVVSDAVDGISPREPVQQRTPEQIEDVSQFREETTDVVELVPRERVQQRTAEPKEDNSSGSCRDRRGGDAGPA